MIPVVAHGPALSGPALGLLELCSVARGVQAADAMLKRAPVRLVRATPVHPGKFVIVIEGGVDEVYESMAAASAVAAEALVDQLVLPNPHSELVAVLGAPCAPKVESIGIIETYSIASTIKAADVALKAAYVSAVKMRLADGLGGKGVFLFTGLLHDIEAAMGAAIESIPKGMLAGQEIIANPHPDLLLAL